MLLIIIIITLDNVRAVGLVLCHVELAIGRKKIFHFEQQHQFEKLHEICS